MNPKERNLSKPHPRGSGPKRNGYYLVSHNLAQHISNPDTIETNDFYYYANGIWFWDKDGQQSAVQSWPWCGKGKKAEPFTKKDIT